MIAWPLGCTSTAAANIAPGLKPKCHSTASAMKVAPSSSRQALMICTQVVASMPPKVTYMIISTPTITTATTYGSPNSSSISLPAPTICAIR
jgi:hypothetical protein